MGTENTHNRWSATIPPVLTVPSGVVVELHTREASDGQITEATGVDDLADIDFGLIHALMGPIYVEGASPGDVLAVTIHEVEVSGWGWATILPGFGFLADEFTEPWIRGFPMEPGATEVRFNDDITLSLAPFAGVLGVAPATDSMLVTIPPRTNGGNMDNRHMTAGTTVYLPVQVDGALFSIGDTHAAQGDGEVSGTAIEAPMRIVLTLEVIENTWGMIEPQYETGDYYAPGCFVARRQGPAPRAPRPDPHGAWCGGCGRPASVANPPAPRDTPDSPARAGTPGPSPRLRARGVPVSAARRQPRRRPRRSW